MSVFSYNYRLSSASYIWFRLKGLQIYVQFIEGGAESDTNSDSEGVDLVEDLNEADTVDGDSSHLSVEELNEADTVDDDSSHLSEQVMSLFFMY